MFSLYRRHEDSCRFKKKGSRHHTCSCPVWMDGYDTAVSAAAIAENPRSWSHAQVRLTELEEGRAALPESNDSPKLTDAIESYLADCKTRRLEPSTITSYTNTLGHMSTYFPGARAGG